MQNASTLPPRGPQPPEQLPAPRRTSGPVTPAPDDDQLDEWGHPDDDGRDPYDIEYDR